MNGQGDEAFEELRRANPVSPSSVAGLGSSARADAMLSRILEGNAPSTRRAPWWRRRYVVLPAVIVVCLASAAAGYVVSKPVKRPLQVACYGASRTTALAVVVSSTGGAPAAACRHLWRHGPLGHTGAPPMYACVLASGSVAVFPSRAGSPCARLGLAPPAGSSPPPAALETLQRVLRREELAADGCLRITAARADAERAVRRAGLRGWRVVVETRASTLHCASYGIDPVERVVHVVPQQRT